MDWKRKLSSRKLWAMIANFVSMVIISSGVAQTTAERIAAMVLAAGGIIAYILSEGAIDAASVGTAPATDVPAEPPVTPTIVHGFVVNEDGDEEDDDE